MLRPVFMLLACSCASTKVPVRLYAETTMSDSVVNETYLIAQALFEKEVGCKAPKVGTVIIKDRSLKDINTGRNVFVAGTVAIAIGLYNTETHLLSVADKHPDKPRVLFHEFLHFMFDESPNCTELARNEAVQHTIINHLTDVYIKKTRRQKTLSDEWLYIELEKLGFKRKQG